MRISSLWQDVRQALRGWRRSPGFALIAVLTLAVGIGVNATVFTIAGNALFKGFSVVPDNDRLLYITTTRNAVYYPDFEFWRAQARSFDDVALVRGVFSTLSSADGGPSTYFTTEVTANTFRLLGVSPILGRDFLPADQEAGAEPVVMLRNDLWRAKFAADPSIVGHTIRLNGAAATVIGVMPPGFSFPENQSLWTPLVPTPAAKRRDGFYARYAVARLDAGATIATARAELDTIGRQLASEYPGTNRDVTPLANTYREFFIGPRAVSAYEAIWGAVGFVLLIACGNAGNLLLQRANGRTREVSVRLALGASRARIIRQLLLESLALSSLAGLVGWWIAQASLRVYESVSAIPGGGSSQAVDPMVLLYLAAIATASGLLSGLPAALHLTKPTIDLVLRDNARGVLGGLRGQRLSDLLVAAEVALTLVVLTGAGLMIRSIFNVLNADIGVNPGHVLTMSMYVPPDRYADADAPRTFYRALVPGLESVPGVESVALAGAAPTELVGRQMYEIVDAPAVDDQARPVASRLVVTPGYFRTLQTAMIAGREFDGRDAAPANAVAIVNEAFAKKHGLSKDSPGSALGKRVRFFRDGVPQGWLTIVGVASNVVQNDRTRQANEPVIYLPFEQQPQPNMFVFARTSVPPETVAAAFTSRVYAIDPTLPVPALMPLDDRLSRAYAFERGVTGLFLAFGIVALTLAVVGVYATVAQSVAARVQEVGLRIAIGATANDIRALVFGHVVRPVSLGVVCGLGAAWATAHALRSILVHVSPIDPATLASVAALTLIAAAIGCLLPAQRAIRIDPAIALRRD